MNRNPDNGHAASYVLAGLFLSMLVAFVACDLNAVRREAFNRDDSCSSLAMRACFAHVTATIKGVPGILIAAAE